MFPILKHQNNIYNLLSKRELGAPASLKKFKDARVIQNMTQHNCTKTIFNGHDLMIRAFDVQDYFAATVSSDDTIKLWNLETGKCLWTFAPNQTVHWAEKIKIIEGNIVCGGSETTKPWDNDRTIRIISLQTGVQTALITESRLEIEKICMLGKQIFCVLNDGNIGEWDLSGRFIQLINSEKLSDPFSRLLGLGSFLVHISQEAIMIHDTQKNSKTKLNFEKGNISAISAHIDSNYLSFGFTNLRREKIPDFCVIDLENGNTINQYRLADTLSNEPYFIEAKKICTVIMNKKWIYLGDSKGMVIAYNLAQKSHVLLGEHKAAVYHLAIEGDILVSGSDYSGSQQAELKFWNIKLMKKIGKIVIPSLHQVSFAFGKVLAALERSLVQWDYLTSNKGELITKGSALAIEGSFHHNDCPVQ